MRGKLIFESTPCSEGARGAAAAASVTFAGGAMPLTRIFRIAP
jgi:hypothetical protein